MACFHREGDRLVYLALLREAAAKSACAVHAYCLMTNHVHLLVTPSDEATCATMMHAVAQRYAQYFNGAAGRTGALWEGRFRSCLVESARYVLSCYRYIELNPVRAGMVSSPEAYPWSSYAGNSGGRDDALLTPHADFASLGPFEYREMVAAGLDETTLSTLRAALDGGLAALESVSGRRLSPGKPGRPPRARPPAKSVDVPDFSGGGAF